MSRDPYFFLNFNNTQQVNNGTGKTLQHNHQAHIASVGNYLFHKGKI